MLEVTKFLVEKSSNVHNDNMLEVSENIFIPKPLMACKIPRYWIYLGFTKIHRFRFFSNNQNRTNVFGALV